jgi:hypothetical protein
MSDNLHAAGHLVDSASVITGVPVTVATVLYGINLEAFIMYGTAILVGTSLIKLTWNTCKAVIKKANELLEDE